MSLLAALFAALSVLALRGHRHGVGAGRLTTVLSRRPGPLACGPSGERARRPSPPTVACMTGGIALAVLLARPAGVVLGVALAAGGPRLLARLEPAEERAARAQLQADLPLLLDLLASCLAGGAPLAQAAQVVAQAVPGPAGRRMAQVSADLAVGTPAAQAWARLTTCEDDPLAPAARALGRAAEGGAPVAAAVARLAADARARARAQGEQAARRVGVVVVAPLGLCFLPAFMLIGVVPVIAGLVAPLLTTF